MPDLAILTTEQASQLLQLSRTTLYRWYDECRVYLTGAIGGAVRWDRDKLLSRREQLSRQWKAAIRARARQRRLGQLP
jgi:predicted DNA-binding transcriptional regulator AlpA